MITTQERDELLRRLKVIRPTGGCCCHMLYGGQCVQCHVDAMIAALTREQAGVGGCDVRSYSSRVCELGTKCCVTKHASPPQPCAHAALMREAMEAVEALRVLLSDKQTAVERRLAKAIAQAEADADETIAALAALAAPGQCAGKETL